MRYHSSLFAVPLALLVLTGCGDDSASEAASASPTSTWLLKSEPAGAVSVTEAKADTAEGDAIVVRGRIGGRKTPLSPESPVFTIVDLGMPYCGEVEIDGCATPWDYCCETPEDLRTNAATVQVVDASGAALAVDPVASGLKPLDEVVIVGTVGPRPSDDVLTIKASGVYRD